MQPPVTDRVRAARGAKNMSLDEFADAIHIGRSTLIRIENGTRDPRDHELQAMADVSGLPYEFFTVTNLDDALGADVDDSLRDRVERLETQLDDLRRALVVDRFDRLSKRPGAGGRGSSSGQRSQDRPGPGREAGDR